MKKGWSARLDLDWLMIDVWALALTRWDYLLAMIDGGVTPKYREYFVSHSFSYFIYLVGRVILV